MEPVLKGLVGLYVQHARDTLAFPRCRWNVRLASAWDQHQQINRSTSDFSNKVRANVACPRYGAHYLAIHSTIVASYLEVAAWGLPPSQLARRGTAWTRPVRSQLYGQRTELAMKVISSPRVGTGRCLALVGTITQNHEAIPCIFVGCSVRSSRTLPVARDLSLHPYAHGSCTVLNPGRGGVACHIQGKCCHYAASGGHWHGGISGPAG